MSGDAIMEGRAPPPASEAAVPAPAVLQEESRPTGRFKRTLKAVADWADESGLLEWFFDKGFRGAVLVVGVAELALLSLFAPDVVETVINWISRNDANNGIEDIMMIGLVLSSALAGVIAFTLLVARWLARRINTRRAGLPHRAADSQGQTPTGCAADHRVGNDPGGGGDLAIPHGESVDRRVGWLAFAFLLGAALILLRRRDYR